MSAFVNDRDVLIQSTVPRYAPATDRVLLLAATAQAFKVAATGVASPAAITFTAALINMAGLVDITTSDGSVLELDGNTATLRYAAMASTTTTVTASIVVDGLTYTASQTVSKVFDGITGNSSRVAYSKTSLSSLASAPATISSEGAASFPPDNAWGAGTVWEGSPQEFAAGESLYRSDGIFNPASGTTTWVAPYLNALKVGRLSAISADLGAITAGTLRAVTIHGGAGYPTPSYAWPTNGGMGYHLSSFGLRLGNIALGTYFDVTANGELYAPGLSIALGGAIFSGALAGATGTFKGALSGASGTFSGALSGATGTFSGALSGASGTFSGDLSSARVSVGPASSATAFFEPDYASVSLNSSAAGVFTADSTISSASVFTSDQVKFKHNDAVWPIERRIRSGAVFFSIICTAVVDDQLSVWYRINGGSWEWLSGVLERQGGDGTAATGYGLTITVTANAVVEFGVSGTNSSLTAADMGKLYLKQCQATVIARNF